MNDAERELKTPANQKPRFSLGTLLLWIAIFALTANTIVMNRELSRMKQEVAAQQPLPAQEVARQFEKSTTLGPITTSVRDVRYSEDDDAYRVKFSWTDSTTGKTWYSDVRLKHDGFGVYYGQIRNGPFIKPLGRSDSYSVSVETPSPLNT